MKVLLIMPYHCDLIHAVSLPLGLISIGSYLKKHGHDVMICDEAVERISIKKVYTEFKPDIIGLSFPSAKSTDGIVKISKLLRGFGKPIVWGGQFCDIVETKHLLNTGVVDIISFCEGEGTWLDLVTALENGENIHKVRGIAYLDNGEIVRTEDRPFLNPYELPKLDWTLVDVKKYYQYLYGCKRLVYVYLSKGCPARCTFCINHLSHRCTYRRRDFNVFLSEVRQLVEDYGVDGLYFCDEVCFLNRKEIIEVCDAFDSLGLDFKWGFQTRIGLFDGDDFERVYKSGCRWIDFGVESGNREMLDKINKKIPYDLIESTFEMCEKIGIISLANFVIGFPGETEAQLMDTVSLALRIKATQCSFLKYCFFATTPLGKDVIESGAKYPVISKLKDYKKVDFFLNRQVNVSNVKQKDIDVIQSHFLWKAIFRKDYASARSYDLLIKSIWTAANRFAKMDFKCGCQAAAEIVYLFSRFFIDEHFYSKTHKKYNL